MESVKNEMFKWAKDLFPINRSLTGDGVRETLNYIGGLIPELQICSVPSGYRAFDWEVPEEWSITEGYIEDESGNRILDFNQNNLHVLGYSEAVDEWLSLAELQEHLYSLPDQPDAIPYVTSYYKRRWGFCLSHNQRQSLSSGKYHVVIRAKHFKGVLNYGEIVIPGESEKEVFFSTYICHPSMANNEISGPVVTTAFTRWIKELKNRRYTYRIIFVPETIGSLVYLSKHLEHMRKTMVAGFVVSCVGDDRSYSHISSRNGETLADRTLQHVLGKVYPDYYRYTWFDRGSDERQYCAPGVDLPVAGFSRSKYGEYPEYHTSLDDLTVISEHGLSGSLKVFQHIIELIEANERLKVTVLGEPHLGKRGLYPTLSQKNSSYSSVRTMMNLISFCDGEHTLLQIAEKINQPAWELIPMVQKLKEENLLLVVK